MAQMQNNETSTQEICSRVYEALAECQFPSGEFGKLSVDAVRREDDYRHPPTEAHISTTLRKVVESGSEDLSKPNCSITLIAAEGISRYKGTTDPMVRKAAQWFTESHHVLDGWFRRGVHIVDKDPFRGEPQLTFITGHWRKS